MEGRKEALIRIEGRQFDVCVIGGGASGAGCALDAQLRGLNTVLLEAADFASAASSASTKIIHGGVRYLQQAVMGFDLQQLHVVKRALRERILMLHNAPFLAHAIDFLVPCFGLSQAFYFRAGMKVYDWLAGNAGLARSHYVSRRDALQHIPRLKSAGLAGLVAYSDGQFDDARYALALVQTFAECGGVALNYARVAAFERNAQGKLAGAQVEDRIDGLPFVVRARAFVNATGPFADHLRELATPGVRRRMRPSKGSHIILPLEGFHQNQALLIPKTEDGRVIFAVPWMGRLLVGTTDDEASPEDEAVLSQIEVEYLLRHLNRYLKDPFTKDQVLSGMAGLRPLVSSGDRRATRKLARDHVVELDAQSGLVSILGGKWTTYRGMAEDTINAVQNFLGVPVTPCRTHEHRLSGQDSYDPNHWRTLVDAYHIPENTARHLSRKFGTNASRVLGLTNENPGLGQPLLEGSPHIRAEVVYGVRYEMACTLEDVLARRLGLQLWSWRDAIRAAAVVADLLAQELGWPAERRQRAVDEYVCKIDFFMKSAGVSAAA